MDIRFSRHAKNKMRLYRLDPEEVEDIVHVGERLNHKDKIESRRGNLRIIWLEGSAYAFVVTVIREKGR